MRLTPIPTPTISGPRNGGSISFAPILARGPQGLPGPGSAAWVAGEAVTTGAVRQAPDGSYIKSTASRTTRSSFDATEQGFWTSVGSDPTTFDGIKLAASYVASGAPRLSGKAQGLKYDGTDETTKVNTILNALASFGGGVLEVEGPLRCDSQIVMPTTTVGSQVRQAPIRITGVGSSYGPGSTFTGGAPFSASPGLDLRYAGRTDAGCVTTKGSAYIANTAATANDRGNIVVGTGIPDQCWILAVDAGAGWIVSKAARASGTVSLTSFGGRIQALGYGTLELDHLQLYNGGTASSAPFGLSTGPKIELHDCAFYGDTSKGSNLSDEDPWVFGGPGQGTMLTTGLTSGNTYTTLAVQALPVAITAGRDVILNVGAGTTQRVTVPSGAAAGATSITVTSFTANANYPAKTGVYIGYAQNQGTATSWNVASAPYQGYASHVERNQFYRCRRIVAGGFATDLYIEHNAWMHNCGSNLALAPSTLTTGLTSGATVTSLAVTALAGPVLAGDVIQVGVGDTSQEFTASADAAAGATSVSVNSVTANATYAVGTKAFNTTAGLGAMVESYAIDTEINAVHVIGNRMGFSGLYNYATRFVGYTEQSMISGNNFQDVQADARFIAGHRFDRNAAFNLILTGVLGSGVTIADDWSASSGLRQQTIVTAAQSKPARFPQNIILGNALTRLGGTTFTLNDTLGNTDLTISGTLRTWAVKGPLSIDGNSGGAGSTALQLGNNSTASDAVITLNPPTGQAGSIQWKRAGTNSWLLYDGAGSTLFLRDSVNAKMHVTYTAGSGAGGGTTEFNSGVKVDGGLTLAYVAKSAAYTLTDKDYTVNADATGGAFALTLPAASAGRTGLIYVLRKSDSSANAVTVTATGGQTINGSTTYALTTQYQTVRIQCDGANWMVI